MSYSEMTLAPELKKALDHLKFVEPTEIQAAVIPIATEGRDLMACAETGSGKTAAYAIPMISRLLQGTKSGALILAPTRELAQQISDFVRDLTAHCRDLQVCVLVGGADMRRQLNTLRRRPRIIVATPGRLIDHLSRKSLRLDSTEILVLDEGDRMLDMGFAPQLDEILRFLPKARQTSLFSATLPDKVKKLAAKYLHNPENINVGRISLPVASIKQSVIQLGFKEKDSRIADELNKREGSVIIFARTQRRTDSLARDLRDQGFDVGLIHGGRTQGQRNRAIKDFKSGSTRILCATDIAARGIDVPQVEHVINFDLPMMSEDYVHRIGRTARNGAKGEAVSFVTPEDHRAWVSLARRYKIPGVELQGSAPRGGGSSSGGGRGGRRGGQRSFSGESSSYRGSGGGRGRSSSSSSSSSGDKRKRYSKSSSSEASGPFSRFSRGPKKEASQAAPGGERRPKKSFSSNKPGAASSKYSAPGSFKKRPKKKPDSRRSAN